jgi:uncharacterized membrane protein
MHRAAASHGSPAHAAAPGTLTAVPGPRELHVRRMQGAFGEDAFGRGAEAAARFFGTPRYIVAQTVAVIVWIALNAAAVSLRWDPYPFILLNLAFSTQAAYAAPLILLAQTRQADRDRASLDHLEEHRELLIARVQASEEAIARATAELRELLARNTELTQQDRDLTEHVAQLTAAIHARVAGAGDGTT